MTIAARELHAFARAFDATLEVHWFLDRALIPLAQALLRALGEQPGLRIEWHPVDAARLFRGSGLQKAREAMRLARALKRVWPRATLLLHRDWRYQVLIRLVSYAPIFGVSRGAIAEGEAYAGVFEALARQLGLERSFEEPASESASSAVSGGFTTAHIGILVGGARNAKGVYLEKRWPHFAELARLIQAQTQLRVFLFGASEDAADAEAILSAVGHDSRFENRVGRLALSDLPRELAPLGAFVSVDSGLAHIAAAVMRQSGQRVITLFGPTSPVRWAPRASGAAAVFVLRRDLPCAPCYADDGRFSTCIYTGPDFQKCMKEVAPAEVLALLQRA